MRRAKSLRIGVHLANAVVWDEVWLGNAPTPYANAAAIGSLNNFTFSSPASSPAAIVASHCASSKYAGTVITARVIFAPPAKASA